MGFCFRWGNVADFNGGNGNIIIPAGLSTPDPVYGMLSAPTLPPGSYVEVTVAVKYVGTGATPDWGMVSWGGTGVLYEEAPMETFTIS